ncbi:PREDICTED: protein SLOW GREEN 1, chloroplastic [Tarenaya hassleriana]|uniref:protein SLOW GREEN 1, chloroplastic n=1 Tax=Tarenaya hassleriana TaxID=28532 RepID=UPI00053C7171|nr:PREDICTED: protein SLOW GREEN 1, chloroplastic [Tarenaya hassleriana]
MASPAKFHCSDHSFHLSLNRHRVIPLKSSIPFSLRTISKSRSPRIPAIRALSSSPKPSLLKTTCVTLTAAAALFSASLHLVRPAVATPVVAPPPSTAERAEEAGEEDEVSLEQQEAALEQHLASNPNDVEALQSLVKIKFQSQKLRQAITILDRLIEIEPDEHEWPVLKAQLQTYNGDYDSATRGFEEILAKDPFRVEAYHGLVMAYSDSDSKLSELENRINGVVEKCKEEKKQKDLRDFMLLIAQIRVIEGNPMEALRVYEELVKDEPEDFRPYLCQGLIYTLMKKKDEAEKQFEQFRRLVPENHPYMEYFDSNMINTQKLFSKKQ